MNYRNFAAALSAGILSAVCFTASAQSATPEAPSSAAAPAAAPAPAAVQPVAMNAKIGIVAFQQVVVSTNEGQRSVVEVEKKYEATRAKLQSLSEEVDGLKKQLQSNTQISDEERANRVRTIDTKDKQLQREAEDFRNGYQADADEALKKVAAKVFVTLDKYAKDNGYTMILDVSNEQSSTILWAVPQTNVSAAILEAYNKSSGVTPPPAATGAPAAPRSTTPRTTPRSTTPAAPAKK